MNAGGTLLLLILFIVGLGFLWVYTGGPQNSLTQYGMFLQPPAPLGTGESYNLPGVNLNPSFNQSFNQKISSFQEPDSGGTIGSKAASLLDYYFSFRTGSQDTTADSPYKDSISLSANAAQATDPTKEYITIRTSNRLTTPITITGWTLEAVSTGVKVQIGEAAQIPFLGQINVDGPVTMPAASTMYVTTGRAPNGTSFRVNQCTGYFAQFQSFTPALTRQCPTPANEMLLFPQQVLGNDQCATFVQQLPSCTLITNTMPPTIGTSCQDFILNQLSYNGCITTHRYDAGFYKNEWRMYLNRSQELWKNTHERIRLLDENGKLVASVTY